MSIRRVIPCLIIGVVVGLLVSFGVAAFRTACGQESTPDSGFVPVSWEQCAGVLGRDHGVHHVLRTKTPGGWLVVVIGNDSSSSVFVPDPTHDWCKERK